MKNKMGRPPLPQGTAKQLLVATKLSGENSKIIAQDIKESGKSKSEWLRDAAMEKARNKTLPKTKEFIDSLLEDPMDAESRDLVATLTADGLPPSIGLFSLGSEISGQGHFRPTDSSTLSNYPLHGAILKVS